MATAYAYPTDLAIFSSNMARRRLQQQGNLYRQGGFRKLRWREDQIDAKGVIKRRWSKPVWIGPCDGRAKLTETEARRFAWDNFLSKLDQNNMTPLSVLTVQEFVETRFRPKHLVIKKKATRIHYNSLLNNHILPAIGKLRLRDVSVNEVQAILAAKLAEGKSTKTIDSINTVVSAIFTYAKRCQCFTGDNPASLTTVPKSSAFDRVGRQLPINSPSSLSDCLSHRLESQ